MSENAKYIPTKDEVEMLYRMTEGLKRGKMTCKMALSRTNGNVEEAKESIQRQQLFLF